MNTMIGYELFLPQVVAHLRSKQDQEDNWVQVTDTEFRQMVGVSFRDAVIKFMKDSRLYRTELPIDLYKQVKRYDLIPPDGWLIESVISTKDHKIKTPGNCCTLESIELTCCPERDMQTAFFVEVSLSAKRSISNCKFDEQFLEMHYEVILNGILHRMYAMRARQWSSSVSSLEHQKLYRNGVNDAKRQQLTAGKAITISVERLTNGTSC